MSDIFGPWATAMASAQLSSFWRRRMYALPALATTPARRGRWLSVVGLVLLGVPLALPQQPGTTTAQAPEPLFPAPQPPADEPAEKQAARLALHKAYALADGETLKLIMPPFRPERTAWVRAMELPRDMDMSYLLGWVWNERSMERHFGVYTGPENYNRPDHSLALIVKFTLRLRFSEFEGPGRQLLDRNARADVVIRAGTTREQAVEPLAHALREQFHVPVRLTLRTEQRDVWVARGKVTLAPKVTPFGIEAPPFVQIYGKEPPPALTSPEVGSQGGTPLDGFLDCVGMYIGRQVIADGLGLAPTQPKVSFYWRRDRAADSGDEGAVIKNVADQTGLAFTRERRDVRVLWVEKVE